MSRKGKQSGKGSSTNNDDVPHVDFTAGNQSSEELIQQAAQLLGARRRVEADIKKASEAGDYSTVVHLVKQRENLNQLLKDVFEFADGTLNGDSGTPKNENDQWWLDEENKGSEPPAGSAGNPAHAGDEATESKTAQAVRLKTKSKSSSASASNSAESKKNSEKDVEHNVAMHRNVRNVSRKTNQEQQSSRPSTAAGGRKTRPLRSASVKGRRRSQSAQARPKTANAADTQKRLANSTLKRRSEYERTRRGTRTLGSLADAPIGQYGETEDSIKTRTHRHKQKYLTESQKFIQRQRQLRGYKIGVLASAEFGIMQAAPHKVVYGPLIRPGEKRDRAADGPGPGAYNLNRNMRNGGFSMHSGTVRSAPMNPSHGAAADYDVRDKLGGRGHGFSRVGNQRLWFHNGAWMFGSEDQVKNPGKRDLCTVYTDSGAQNVLEVDGADWNAHKSRVKSKAMANHVNQKDSFLPVHGVHIASKFKKRASTSPTASPQRSRPGSRHGHRHRRSNSNSSSSSSSSSSSDEAERPRRTRKARSPQRRAPTSAGPSNLIVTGFSGFHSRFNGEYVKDARAGLVSGRPVYKLERSLDSSGSKVPGPGEYDLATRRGTRGGVMAGKRYVAEGPRGPGPGQYALPDTNTNRASGFGKGDRPDQVNNVSVPGPGAYDPKKGEKAKPASFPGAGTGRNKLKESAEPGPGHYLKHFY